TAPMGWVPKECANGRLFRSILLMSFMYGYWFAPHLHAEPVKVAVLLPFSGVYKDLGLDAKNGFLLGLKKEAGEAKVHVESWVTFDFVDDLADADHSLELAKQVIEEGAKAILGIVSSAVAWSCTSSLRIISPLSKPGKMPPDHTTMRGHYHDSVSC